jgi:hypothetical protein
MEYNGYKVDVTAHLDADAEPPTYHATYTIHSGDVLIESGTVAGVFSSIDAAEAQAEQAARRWIDEQQP